MLEYQNRKSDITGELCQKYSGRGLRQSVREDAQAQELREEETAGYAPDAYRYSSWDAGRQKKYKTVRYDGSEFMTSEDLVRYFRDGHRRTDEDCESSAEEENALRWGGAGIVSDAPQKKLIFIKNRKSKTEKQTSIASVNQTESKTVLQKWFPKDRTQYVNAPKCRRFPSTYLAALFVVILSMAIIVGSSLVLHRQQTANLDLKNQLQTIQKNTDRLEAELDIKNDLNAVRQTAIREYGMIDGNYVTMKYLMFTGEEQILAYRTEEEKKVGLSALLSAILGNANRD